MSNRENLKKISGIKLYVKDSIIFREEDPSAEEMFLLLNGSVGLFKNLGGNAPVLIDILPSDSTFGELSMFTDEPQSVTAVALSAVTAVTIRKNDFPDFVKSNPDAAIRMIENLSKRLFVAQSQVVKPLPESLQSGFKKIVPMGTKLVSSIFPEGHKSYPLVMPEAFKDCIISSTITCPCCKEKYTILKPLTSKLRGGAPLGCDMRTHYLNFDLAWTNVVTCPTCYFSSFIDYVDKKSLLRTSMNIKEELSGHKEALLLNFSEDFTLDLVFSCHYLALVCAKAFYNENQITAKLWLQLSYLYSDVKDEAMYTYAVKKAFESYQAFYGNSDMLPEQEQVCCLILAHLCIQLDKQEMAMQYLSNVYLNKNGLPAYKQMAGTKRDELIELRRGIK